MAVRRFGSCIGNGATVASVCCSHGWPSNRMAILSRFSMIFTECDEFKDKVPTTSTLKPQHTDPPYIHCFMIFAWISILKTPPTPRIATAASMRGHLHSSAAPSHPLTDSLPSCRLRVPSVIHQSSMAIIASKPTHSLHASTLPKVLTRK